MPSIMQDIKSLHPLSIFFIFEPPYLALTAFSRVTPPIQMHDQTILTRSFDPMNQHLTPAEVGSQSY